MGVERKRMASETLPIHMIGLYQDAFNSAAKGTGSVDASGVGAVMRSVGQNPSEAEIADLINQVDRDGTGNVDFPEFLAMMCIKTDQEDAEDQIREVFQVFDGDGSGFINRQELSCVMANLGIELTAEEVEGMIDEADLDGDGQINYEDGTTMLYGK